MAHYGYDADGSATQTVTIDARIWQIKDIGAGAEQVQLYMDSPRHYGTGWFYSKLPLSASDTTTWFRVTLEGKTIVGISI